MMGRQRATGSMLPWRASADATTAPRRAGVGCGGRSAEPRGHGRSNRAADPGTSGARSPRDPWGAVPGRQAAQVGEASLSDDDVYVVLGVVDMADHRDDRTRSRRPWPSRATEESREKALRVKSPGRRSRSDGGAHDVRGIDVAVDVRFQHAVHGDDAEPAMSSGWLEISSCAARCRLLWRRCCS